jgi:tetratricopeptide (TPR) repeat protein
MVKIKQRARNFTFVLLSIFVMSLLLLYLFVNILSSQLISPLYFQIAKEDRKSVIVFLEKIKDFPSFPYFLDIHKKIYGNQIEQNVFAEEVKRKETIQNLELLLTRNSKSRDILYNLSILYHEDDNPKKAGEYLKRAQEIDPTI